MSICILPPVNKLEKKTVASDTSIDLIEKLMTMWKGLHLYLFLYSINKVSPDFHFYLGYVFQNIVKNYFPMEIKTYL